MIKHLPSIWDGIGGTIPYRGSCGPQSLATLTLLITTNCDLKIFRVAGSDLDDIFLKGRAIHEITKPTRKRNQSLTVDAPQSFGRRDDADAFMTAERQQMLVISRDDEVGLCGHGGGDDLIVIGIVLDHARDLGG